jgi:hypothetical protein
MCLQLAAHSAQQVTPERAVVKMMLCLFYPDMLLGLPARGSCERFCRDCALCIAGLQQMSRQLQAAMAQALQGQWQLQPSGTTPLQWRRMKCPLLSHQLKCCQCLSYPDVPLVDLPVLDLPLAKELLCSKVSCMVAAHMYCITCNISIVYAPAVRKACA